MLSPTASNAPARDDTHLAARNVPVGGDGLPDGGAPSSRTHLRAPGLYPQGPCSWPQVRSRRRAGSVARVYGVGGGVGCAGDDVRLTCLCTRSDRATGGVRR